MEKNPPPTPPPFPSPHFSWISELLGRVRRLLGAFWGSSERPPALRAAFPAPFCWLLAPVGALRGVKEQLSPARCCPRGAPSWKHKPHILPAESWWRFPSCPARLPPRFPFRTWPRPPWGVLLRAAGHQPRFSEVSSSQLGLFELLGPAASYSSSSVKSRGEREPRLARNINSAPKKRDFVLPCLMFCLYS